MLASATGIRFGLMEAEVDVEPAFWAGIRGETKWDAFTLWVALVAGVLLLIDLLEWAYFGWGLMGLVTVADLESG